MFGSSRCQILNIINLWRAVSVIYLLYNSSINIGVAANKNMFNNIVQTLSETKPRENLFENYLKALGKKERVRNYAFCPE